VDVVKCLESCILNINLTNVNAFFIADKGGKYVYVSNMCFLTSCVFWDIKLYSPLENIQNYNFAWGSIWV
jgi:hypothetical protein